MVLPIVAETARKRQSQEPSDPAVLLFNPAVSPTNSHADSEKIVANGGVIVQPLGGDAPEITARFRDPAGNIVGIHKKPTLSPPVV
ncbi:MAG: hypothetical protein ABJE47_20275 [bacterium]